MKFILHTHAGIHGLNRKTQDESSKSDSRGRLSTQEHTRLVYEGTFALDDHYQETTMPSVRLHLLHEQHARRMLGSIGKEGFV